MDEQTARGLRADAEANRLAVLTAAREVWAANPTAPVSAIADAAGVHRGTVYRRYPTRGALAAELRALAAQESLETVTAAVAGSSDPLDALHAAVVGLAELAGRYQALYLPALTTPAPPADQNIREALRVTVERAQGIGRLRSDVPADWIVTVISAHLAAAARAQQRGAIDPDHVASLLWTTLMHGVARTGTASREP